MASPAGGAGDGSALVPSASKGKSKMDDEADGVTCGICLADARREIRGELDCCAHHFCFVCIMAWARVESRCPFCKARFRTIRRPPVPGRFPSERLVTVSERNQVYRPLGNESSTVDTDPYANTSCSVCNCSRDDDLLLLCELCDAAAHTYCVGLGTTVPEGDWFCKDCATSKEEHSRYQIDDGGSGDQVGFEISIEVPRAEPVAAPSIFDIIDEDYSPSSVHRTNAQSSRPFLVDPVPSIFDIVDEDYTTNPVRRTNARSTRPERKAEHLPSQSTSAGSQCPESPQERDNHRASLHAHTHFEVERARTLRNSRNLNYRIRVLRENWPAIQSGSVGFATYLPNNRRENGTESVTVVREHQLCATPIVISSKNGAAATSVKEHQQSAMPFTEETPTISGHANKTSPKDTHNVHKAWKMLEMAKSAGDRKKSNMPSSLNCSSPFSMGNRSSSYSPIDIILGQMNESLFNEVTQKNTAKYDCGTKKENTLPTKNSEENRSLPENYHVSVHEKMVSFQDRMVNQESPNGKVASSSHSQHIDQTLESLRGTVRSGKPKSDVLHPLTCSLSSGRSMVTSSLQLGPCTGSQSTTMVKPDKPSDIRVATANEIGTAGATVEVRKSSGPDRHECKRKLCFETSDDQGSKTSRKSFKTAKSEISSLAIRELKLLKIDKTHGSDRFKEVARAATHTILASCGLEHSPSLALAVSRPVCKHNSRTDTLKSSAITNSCRECLCNFVKEVISSVLSGRQMDQTAASC